MRPRPALRTTRGTRSRTTHRPVRGRKVLVCPSAPFRRATPAPCATPGGQLSWRVLTDLSETLRGPRLLLAVTSCSPILVARWHRERVLVCRKGMACGDCQLGACSAVHWLACGLWRPARAVCALGLLTSPAAQAVRAQAARLSAGLGNLKSLPLPPGAVEQIADASISFT